MFNRLVNSFRAARVKMIGHWQEASDDVMDDRDWVKYGLIGLLLAFVVLVVLSFLWNDEPEMFDVRAQAHKYMPAGKSEGHLIAGVATTSALIKVAETLLDKPGGYLSNDIAPPGVWLDNIPSWESGVLIQVRDLARVIRESFSRSQSQSSEDVALKDAEAQFNFDSGSWILPSTEGEYRSGIRHLYSYLYRLTDESKQDAQFYTRADNLRYWLGTVETRLGSLSQNLSASVGQRRLNTDLAGDAAAGHSTSTPDEYNVHTSWLKVDNIFYEARGASWALLHFLKAVEIDFADVLAKKNARVSLQQIIRELEGTQQTLYSPMVLNGDGFGILANHSLVMANYVSRANAALIDLRELLSRG